MSTYGYLSSRPMDGPTAVLSRRLAMRNTLLIPQLGFGTYRLNPGELTTQAVSYALQCGYRHIDCATAYHNQRDVGKAVSDALAKKLMKREDLFLTSKIWPTDQHPSHVEAACRQTLQDLRVEYLDLLLVHWPVCWRRPTHHNTNNNNNNTNSPDDWYPKNAQGGADVDSSVTLLDTWRAMSALVDQGLVRSLGLSNCGPSHVADVVTNAPDLHAPMVNQVELHPGLPNDRVVMGNQHYGLLTAAYCPLGMPTRHTPPDFVPLPEDPILCKLAERIGYSPQRILLNWCADKNHIVIVKSSKKEHIASNAKVARYTLEHPVAMLLEHFDKAARRFRVVNPTDFYAEPGRPFFDAEDEEERKSQALKK